MTSTSLTSILPPGKRMFWCLQRFADILDIDSQLRDLGVGHIDVDALVLDTGEVDLLDAFHQVEALPDLTRGFMHFGQAESIAPQGDGGHGRVAEGVVDHRPDGAGGQLGFDILHPVAQQFPCRRELFGGHFVFDGHMHQALADFGGGIFYLIHLAHAPDFLFDGPRNQALDLFHGHAGILGRHQRFANRNERVFQFRKVYKRVHPADNYQHDGHDDGARIVQRKSGDPFHFQFLFISLTVIPSAKKLAPATATISPAARPSTTMASIFSVLM